MMERNVWWCPLFTHVNICSKSKESVSFTYLIHTFEFTSYRSSHEKLLFDIETYVLQNSTKSSVLVKVLYVYSSTKDKLPLKYFTRMFV